MKAGRRIRLKLLLILLLFIQVFEAQVTITIPFGNTLTSGVLNPERRKPLGTFFGYERTAFIFRHSEIGQYGYINSIAFYCDSINNPDTTPVRIYIKERPDSAFSNTHLTTVAIEEAGLRPVHTGTLLPSAFVKNHWTTIVLDTPFLHLTSQPLEFIIETNAGAAGNEVSLGKSFYHYANYIQYSGSYWEADNSPPTGLSTVSLNRPNIQLVMTPVSSCTGTPVAGTTISSVDTTCSLVYLSLYGLAGATGLHYQWQDSTLGALSWTSIPFANLPTLADTISATTWFRCKVQCGSSFSYSAIKRVVLRNYLQCYCTTSLGGGCSSFTTGVGSAIDSVALSGTGLVTSHTGCSANNYTLYPAQAGFCAQVSPSQTYTLYTRFTGNVVASVWIDYNQDGFFEHSEWKQVCLSAKADSQMVTLLTIPSGAKNGLTLMRIRSRYSGDSNDSLDACTNFSSGETEDYYIGINYPVGVNSPGQSAGDVIIYPDPADQYLLLKACDVVNNDREVQFFSVTGREVRRAKWPKGSGTLSADLSDLETGLYFIKIVSANGTVVKKLLIRR